MIPCIPWCLSVILISVPLHLMVSFCFYLAPLVALLSRAQFNWFRTSLGTGRHLCQPYAFLHVLRSVLCIGASRYPVGGGGGGYIWKALGKGFSHMYGSRGWVGGRHKLFPARVQDFRSIISRPAWIFTCFGSSFHPCFSVVGPEPS